MPKPHLSVIIPAYNEESRISLTLIDIDKHLRKADYDYEIIAVNDGSKDNTADVIKRFLPLIKNLKFIDNPQNKGKGGVVKQGMLAARGEIRLFTDADNSTSIDHFDKMRQWFNQGYDVVICSRDARGSIIEPPRPWHKTVFGNLGNLFIQALLLPGIWDTQCGFKAFTEEAALKIFPLQKINRWGFDVEILALAKKSGCKIKEIPARWIDNPFSHVKLSAYLQVLWETIKIRWWLWTNAYKL